MHKQTYTRTQISSAQWPPKGSGLFSYMGESHRTVKQTEPATTRKKKWSWFSHNRQERDRSKAPSLRVLWRTPTPSLVPTKPSTVSNFRDHRIEAVGRMLSDASTTDSDDTICVQIQIEDGRSVIVIQCNSQEAIDGYGISRQRGSCQSMTPIHTNLSYLSDRNWTQT